MCEGFLGDVSNFISDHHKSTINNTDNIEVNIVEGGREEGGREEERGGWEKDLEGWEGGIPGFEEKWWRNKGREGRVGG